MSRKKKDKKADDETGAVATATEIVDEMIAASDAAEAEAASAEQTNRHAGIDAELMAQSAERMLRVKQAEDACEQAEQTWNKAEEVAENAKRDAKAKEAYYQAAVRYLRKLARGEAVQTEMFNGDGEAGKESHTAAGSEDAAWRDVPLSEALPFAIVGKLAEADPPITTVGQLADYTTPTDGGYTRRLIDLPGIGQSKAEKIEAGMVAFWERWNAGEFKPQEAAT